VNAELVSELEVSRRRTWRSRAMAGIGPVTVLAGVVWALVQPERITLLHPHGQGFWWLFVEPPLLVVLVGLVFWFFVVPGVLEDLEDAEGHAAVR
jgi:ABC-type polysaccharide/polyol phosphate export permease